MPKGASVVAAIAPRTRGNVVCFERGLRYEHAVGGADLVPELGATLLEGYATIELLCEERAVGGEVIVVAFLRVLIG